MKKKSLNAISVKSGQVLLSSPAFEFVLGTRDGLRAVAWTNRLTGRTLNLGGGPEVEFDLGLPDQPALTPKLRVVKLPAAVNKEDAIEAIFDLEAEEPKASVAVSYRWDGTQPVLRKFVTIANRGRDAWNRLLNARLGEYATGAAKLTGGELVPYPPSFAEWAHQMGGLQGFPVYAEDEFFLTLAHPAGWATQEPGKVSLRHHPGVVLSPGESRDCMEAVYGVGAAGAGRAAFVAHIRSRMRRVARGHDRPYAIFEPFGGRTDGAVDERNRTPDAAYAAGHLFDENEPFLLDMIAKVAEGQCGAVGRDRTGRDRRRGGNQGAPLGGSARRQPALPRGGAEPAVERDPVAERRLRGRGPLRQGAEPLPYPGDRLRRARVFPGAVGPGRAAPSRRRSAGGRR
jgi:hypothetical protein